MIAVTTTGEAAEVVPRRSPLTPEQLRRFRAMLMKELLDAGSPASEIGRIFRLSAEYVRGAVRALG